MLYSARGIKRRKPHSLEPWERQAILDAYLANEKVDAIAAEFGINNTYPGKLARSRNFFSRPKGRPKIEKSENPC